VESHQQLSSVVLRAYPTEKLALQTETHPLDIVATLLDNNAQVNLHVCPTITSFSKDPADLSVPRMKR
jgi:hypothetical protein